MKTIVWLISVIVSVLLSGCVGKEIAPINHYQFEMEHKEAKCNKTGLYGWLGIEAEAKIDTSKIAYIKEPNKVEYFAKNRWIDNLPNLLDVLVLKVARENCIVLAKDKQFLTDTLRLYILDLHYDENLNSAVFEALLEQTKGEQIEQFWILETKEVSKGGFEEIIRAMNESVLEGISKVFARIK